MAGFSSKNIEEIKNKLSIVDIIGLYTEIIDRSGRKVVRCPFHANGNERTPSCIIHEESNTFHCFGCGKSGDIFTVVMEKEGFDFQSAVEFLAQRAGVELEKSNYQNEAAAKRARTDKEKLYDLYSRIAKTYHYLLRNSAEAEEARKYIENRNISVDTEEKFMLGYAPQDSKWLYGFLQSKGIDSDILAKSGLFSRKYPTLSLFRNRIMFPIFDRQGRVIAFSGRDLSGADNVGKYINSPETMIYQKKDNLFGIYQAKKTLQEGNNPIICEGNFDVISLHQAGFTNAVAPLGTAFTQDQVKNLKKWFTKIKGINLLFDSDQAGVNETEKAILLVHKEDLEADVYSLKGGKDPSEILEKKGVDSLKEELQKKTSAFEYLVKIKKELYDINTAKGKSEYVSSLSSFINSTKSKVEIESYITQLSQLLNISDEAVREDLEVRNIETGKRKQHPETFEREDAIAKKEKSGTPTVDEQALFYLSCHPHLFPSQRYKLKISDLSSSMAKDIYSALEQAMREDCLGNDSLLLTYISSEETRKYLSFVLFHTNEYRNLMTEEGYFEALDRIRLKKLQAQRSVVLEQLKITQDESNPNLVRELLERKKDLDEDIQNLLEALK